MEEPPVRAGKAERSNQAVHLPPQEGKQLPNLFLRRTSSELAQLEYLGVLYGLGFLMAVPFGQRLPALDVSLG